MLELTERAGLTEKSVLMCYEIIEFEPTPPAVVLQFDDIRRVLRQEAPLLAKAQAKAPARSLVSIDDVGRAVAFLALDGAKLMTGDTLYIDGGYHIID